MIRQLGDISMLQVCFFLADNKLFNELFHWNFRSSVSPFSSVYIVFAGTDCS